MAADAQTARSIFLEAVERHAPADWDRFLEQACGQDEELRRRVAALLRAHQQANSLLDAPDSPAPGGSTPGGSSDHADRAAPASSATIEASSQTLVGTMIGPYKLLEQIGEGGFGVVYMAEQTEPVRRKVALKILKAGMDTRQVVARFEAERQALAIMDHPNIAKVFDGGMTGVRNQGSGIRNQESGARSQATVGSDLTPDPCLLTSGRPYFVMELVKGVPITEFCDQHHLTPKQRLELFIPVCQAVQHAHQKGIIHRDLKPSNILVVMHDTTPVPKVIDFGIAKALGQELTDKTLFTAFAQMVGTPLYMSPEQAGQSGLDIDTRSDIYSLGVLLYELLTGTTPFDKERFKQAAYEEIRRIIREEDPPKPSTRLSNLGSPLAPREDSADTIATRSSLASVAAQRHTEPAKLTKLIRGELDWIVMKSLEKDRNRRYETANGFSMDVQRYLADEPVQACPPSAGYRLRKFVRRNRTAIVTASLVALAVVIGAGISVWQAVRATQAEGQAKIEAGRANDEAERATREAERANREAAKAVTEAAIAKAVNDFLNNDLLGQASPFNESDRDIKLRTLVERATEKIETRFGDQPLVEASIRQTLGFIHASLGDQDKAELQHRRALDLRRHLLSAEHPDTLWSMLQLATALSYQDKHDEAEKLLRSALAVNEREHGSENPLTLILRTRLGNCLAGQGHLANAEKLHRQTYEIRRRVQGSEHSGTMLSKLYLAKVIKKQGRNAEAEKLYREVLEVRVRKLRPNHPGILETMACLANAIRDQGRLAEAEEIYRDVYEKRRRVLGPRHPATLASRSALAVVVKEQGRHDEVKPLWEEVISHSEQAHKLQQAGRAEEALDSFRRAIRTLEEFADEFPATREYRMHLGRCYIWLFEATTDAAEKKAALDQALPLWQRLAEDFPDVEWMWCDLGAVLNYLGRHQEAVDAHSKAIALNETMWVAWFRRGWTHIRLGRWNVAIADYTKALELNPKYAGAWWSRGEAHRYLKQWDKALTDYEQAIETGPVNPGMFVSKAAALAQLKRPEEAMADLKKAVVMGFHNPNELRFHEGLAAIRERDDFKMLLTELEAKKK